MPCRGGWTASTLCDIRDDKWFLLVRDVSCALGLYQGEKYTWKNYRTKQANGKAIEEATSVYEVSFIVSSLAILVTYNYATVITTSMALVHHGGECIHHEEYDA